MAAKCKKCDPHEICEECPEWIFTLADLIMCMMGLFVLLWVLKPTGNPSVSAKTDGEPTKQEQKMIEQIADIREAFKYVPDPSSSDPVDQYMLEKVRPRMIGPKQKGMQDEVVPAAEGTTPLVQTIREGKLPIVGTRVLFKSGESTLSSDDTRVLDQIAEKITGSRFVTVVKGHAARDDFDEHATPQAFMDVSLKRAQTAADYLVRRGVSPDVLRVQGCSTFEPVHQRAYTADAQQDNRRVEVFSTDVLVRDLQDPERRVRETVGLTGQPLTPPPPAAAARGS